MEHSTCCVVELIQNILAEGNPRMRRSWTALSRCMTPAVDLLVCVRIEGDAQVPSLTCSLPGRLLRPVC
jgi:hypothetical protein